MNGAARGIDGSQRVCRIIPRHRLSVDTELFNRDPRRQEGTRNWSFAHRLRLVRIHIHAKDQDRHRIRAVVGVDNFLLALDPFIRRRDQHLYFMDSGVLPIIRPGFAVATARSLFIGFLDMARFVKTDIGLSVGNYPRGFIRGWFSRGRPYC